MYKCARLEIYVSALLVSACSQIVAEPRDENSNQTQYEVNSGQDILPAEQIMSLIRVLNSFDQFHERLTNELSTSEKEDVLFEALDWAESQEVNSANEQLILETLSEILIENTRMFVNETDPTIGEPQEPDYLLELIRVTKKLADHANVLRLINKESNAAVRQSTVLINWASVYVEQVDYYSNYIRENQNSAGASVSREDALDAADDARQLIEEVNVL